MRNTAQTDKAIRHTAVMAVDYAADIDYSAMHSHIILPADMEGEQKKKGTPRILFTDCALYDAVLRHGGEHALCVIEASHFTPGNGFMQGRMTEEAKFCHHSNLYNIEVLRQDYYSDQEKYRNSKLYRDIALYIPKVRIESDNRSGYADVLLSTPPNRQTYMRSKFAKDANNFRALRNRIMFLKNIANSYSEQIDTLLIGAYGCRDFSQRPEEVAKCLADCFANCSMQRIIVAVSSDNETIFEIFRTKFGEVVV